MRPLIMRADAGIRIGTGHVMRCLALAQAWQDAGGRATFAVVDCPAALVERLRRENVEVVELSVAAGTEHDAARTVELAHERSAQRIVVDGYHFGTDYQKAVTDSGLNLLLVDDLGGGEYHAAAILNQNVYAAPSLYEKASACELLLGPRYALLRREFNRWGAWRREQPTVAQKILVTMGGSDSGNATLKVLVALNEIAMDNLEVKVVIGAANPHYAALSRFVEDAEFSVELITEAMDLSGLMTWADAAVSAAGTTCLELAFMQVPAVVLTLADNQRLVAEHLSKERMAINMGDHVSLSPTDLANSLQQLLLDRDARAEMSSRGRAVVDGEGARRVVRHLSQTALNLKRVDEADSRMLWEWANDPEVRAVSFSSDPIPWEEHIRWLREKLSDPRCFFYVAVDAEGTPVGQIRFDTEGSRATVSISLEGGSRGLGYGTRLIQLGSHRLFAETTIASIVAYVKPDNHASAVAFAKAGYTRFGGEVVSDDTALKFVLQRDEIEGLH